MSSVNSILCSVNLDQVAVESLHENKWQMDGLMLSNAILMTFVVCIGANAPRYRRHPFIGFLLLAATTLFLPIVSIVTSTVRGRNSVMQNRSNITIFTACTSVHVVLALVWTGLVLTIGVTTSEIVAGDSREGRTIAPPAEKIVKTIWIVYLTISTIVSASEQFKTYLIFLQLFAIIFAKLLFKYIAFNKARRSIAHGDSPRLIAGYMAQRHLLGERQCTAPPLLVMREETAKKEEQPQGYSFKGMSQLPDQAGHSRLVTLDRIWKIDNDMLLTPQPKDLCFSFALFKLLRCRFAKYTISESGFLKVHKFFGDTLLQGDDYGRVFRVIADELSFVHYYYYSSLPISYSSHLLLPIFNIAISLYSIGYCLFLIIFTSQLLKKGDYHKIFCKFSCFTSTEYIDSGRKTIPYKSSSYYTDVVPVYLVLTALILAEKRCKVAGHNWGDEMYQYSILVLHPKKFLRQRRNSKKNIKIPSAVKAVIFQTLKREDLTTCQEGNVKAIRPPSALASSWASDTVQSFPSAPGGKGTAYTILAWHIATSVFEMRHQSPSSSSDEPHHAVVVATHLSRYCAYLVAFCPELLPSDEEWCKKLYKDVEKDANRVLADARRRRTGFEFEELLKSLMADSNHEVLRSGGMLGKQLLADSAAAAPTTGWEALAGFWSEMVLYVAPSENLEGHANAITHGGELITLLWAMLAHAGIIGRIDDTVTAADEPDKAATNANGCVDV